MGKNFKGKLKKAWKANRERAKERKKYLSELKEQEKVAERKAYAKERIRRAGERGKRKATPIQWGRMAGEFAAGVDSVSPYSRRPARRKTVVVRKAPKRKRKKIRKTYRKVVRRSTRRPTSREDYDNGFGFDFGI
jgi:hypothetical protein